MTSRLRFGTFTPPIQAPHQDPTWALERNLELVEWCDRIGYDEAWFGEHHNGGSSSATRRSSSPPPRSALSTSSSAQV